MGEVGGWMGGWMGGVGWRHCGGQCIGGLHTIPGIMCCTALLPPHCSGLLYCMEYLEENLEEWLGGELEAYGDDDYLIFDCPGQIELYSHLSVFKTFVEFLKRDGWQICVVCAGGRRVGRSGDAREVGGRSPVGSPDACLAPPVPTSTSRYITHAAGVLLRLPVHL